ncbi:MAG: hypothetical protein K8R63_04775 [Bacteroidales bacterium]|nr:hypothetical protein [Bacteroidales bacterium]
MKLSDFLVSLFSSAGIVLISFVQFIEGAKLRKRNGYWMLDTRYWILDTRYWILDTLCAEALA